MLFHKHKKLDQIYNDIWLKVYIFLFNSSKFQYIVTDVVTIKNGLSKILFGYSTNICIKYNNMCTDVRT